MGRFVKGEVVVLPFPFSDLSQTKRRPAFVVSSLPHDDLILCMITSRQSTDPDSVPLASGDFAEGGLPRSSVVRPTRLFTANESLVLSSRGKVNPAKLTEVIQKIVEVVTR